MKRHPVRARQGPALSPMHLVKLRPPLPREHHLRRPRLLALLDEMTRAPVTLVVAPAGYGKSSLLAGWVAEKSATAAWLSLDETDRDGGQFWIELIAALETVVPGCGERARVLLGRQHRRDDAVHQLLLDLAADTDPTPTLLVVDDFHHVDEQAAVVASVSHFLARLPDWLRVVLASRRDPDLPLGRMRSHGQLSELRLAELRFSPDEAAELLVRLAPSLPVEQIEAVVARADGWAASLQLAALASRGAGAPLDADSAQPGDEVLLADYVLHEVLAHEAPELIDVLYAAAVVPRINARLADVLTDRTDASELLARAERSGLFVSRRDSGTWYDLHGLVREVLTAELAQSAPARMADLHAAAARWFEDADEVITALDQWLRADRPREALRLLAHRHAQLYDTGQEAVIVRVLAAIPGDVAMSDIETMVEYAWCHLLVDRRRFVELVDHLGWWAERASPGGVVGARVTMLRSCAAVVSGHCGSSGELARLAAVELGDAWWRDPIGRFAWNHIAREAALSERWDEDDDEIRRCAVLVSHDAGRRLSFEGIRALGLALSGRPLEALRIASGVRRAAEVSQMTILHTELELAETLAGRELTDRAAAGASLARLAQSPAETTLYCRILAAVELVHAHLDAGDVEAAVELFGQVEHLVESEAFGPDGRSSLARGGVQLALARGRSADATYWASRVDDGFWGPVCTAEVALAAGARSNAAGSAELAVPRCARHEVVLRFVRARSLDDRQAAVDEITEALVLASRHGMVQTVATEGATVMELVEAAAWCVPPEWIDRVRRAAAEMGRSSVPIGRELVEPLTEREREVLRYLPSRLTIREIAAQLCVSSNTMKFHLKVIYRKLGVSSRAEAAEIAREMMRVAPQ